MLRTKIENFENLAQCFQIMIYGMKWIHLMSQTCFEIILIIQTLLETIWRKIKIFDFLNFLFVDQDKKILNFTVWDAKRHKKL